MIYTPKHFEVQQTELIHEIIRRYNFGTLIAVKDITPTISHLPFLLNASSGKAGVGTLMAHMARANPQWRSFQQDAEVTVLFQGPHAYVSPRWYQPNPDNVPTWNYAVIHAHGVPRVLHEEESAFDIMQQLVQKHDPEWTLKLSDQDRREMMREIVVFEIAVTRLEAKFKMSQNRPQADAVRVASELSGSSDQTERETGELMLRLQHQNQANA